MDIQQAIAAVVQGQDLSTQQMIETMRQVMNGRATDAQIAGLLVALRIKGESIDEITAAVEVMRELVTPVQVNAQYLVDTCGTGGDGKGIFNVSTAAAFVAATAGAHVAKHGNRSVSSSSGSADLLMAAGVNINLTPDQVARCITEIGVGFMFAPAHHGAMKHAIGPRRELGIRTLFNMLGPMTNPANVKRQVIGVFAPQLCLPMAQVLQRLGSHHVLVVHSEDGLDEISIAGATIVAELKEGEIREYSICPEDFGLSRQSWQGLVVDGAAQSLALINKALDKNKSAQVPGAEDMIALNAGAALYASGRSETLSEGVLMAQDAIGSGLAREKINELASFSQCFEAENEH